MDTTETDLLKDYVETKFILKLHWPNSEIHVRKFHNLTKAKKAARAAVYDGFVECAEVFDIDDNLVVRYPPEFGEYSKEFLDRYPIKDK